MPFALAFWVCVFFFPFDHMLREREGPNDREKKGSRENSNIIRWREHKRDRDTNRLEKNVSERESEWFSLDSHRSWRENKNIDRKQSIAVIFESSLVYLEVSSWYVLKSYCILPFNVRCAHGFDRCMHCIPHIIALHFVRFSCSAYYCPTHTISSCFQERKSLLSSFLFGPRFIQTIYNRSSVVRNEF